MIVAHSHQPCGQRYSDSMKPHRVNLLVLPFWYLLTRVVPDILQKSSKTVVCVCVIINITIQSITTTTPNKLHRSQSEIIGSHTILGLGAILLLPVQNLMSYSCLVTPISYKGDGISHISRLAFKIWCRIDRRQTTDAATETEGSYTVSVRAQ